MNNTLNLKPRPEAPPPPKRYLENDVEAMKPYKVRKLNGKDTEDIYVVVKVHTGFSTPPCMFFIHPRRLTWCEAKYFTSDAYEIIGPLEDGESVTICP